MCKHSVQKSLGKVKFLRCWEEKVAQPALGKAKTKTF